MRQIQTDRIGRRALADDDIDRVVLHGGVKDLLDRTIEPVDLVHEQNVIFLQVGQQCRQITGLFDRRSGGDAHVHTHLVCDDGSHRRLAKTRRAVEQHVVERLTAQTCRINADLQIFFCFFLTGIILQQPWAQRTLSGILRKHAGRGDDLLLGVLGKTDAHICSLPCLLLYHGAQRSLDDLIRTHALDGRQRAQRRIDLRHTVSKHGQAGDRIAARG